MVRPMRALLLAAAATLASLPAATATGALAGDAADATPDCQGVLPYEGRTPFATKEQNACRYFCEGHMYDSGTDTWSGSCIHTGPAYPVGIRLLAA